MSASEYRIEMKINKTRQAWLWFQRRLFVHETSYFAPPKNYDLENFRIRDWIQDEKQTVVGFVMRKNDV